MEKAEGGSGTWWENEANGPRNATRVADDNARLIVSLFHHRRRLNEEKDTDDDDDAGLGDGFPAGQFARSALRPLTRVFDWLENFVTHPGLAWSPTSEM